jgi:nucleoside-diphosphate-sugar epimerase
MREKGINILRIILTGATGFVGGAVLEQVLQDSAIEKVTLLTRRSLGIVNPKLQEIILKDFTDYAHVKENLKTDACIWCLGVSQTEVSRDVYIQITFDYTMAAARAMFAVNPGMRFCFLSGSGADQEEQSRVLFGKTKGRTEKELLKLSPNVFNFRPAFIRPAFHGQKRPLIAKLYAPLAFIADLFTDSFSVNCSQLARCLLDVAKNGASQSVFDNRTIRNWA